MSHWAPKPLHDGDPNGLFQLEESVTISKSVETPMQRQRRIDGTPHTKTGRTALKPRGPELQLDGLSKSYSINADDDKKEHCDPDEIMKAYLDKND